MDLFQHAAERATPTCGECPNLGDAIESGVRYCWGSMTLRWATERVSPCPYRGEDCRPAPRPEPDMVAAITDLLESPRHSIDAKGRKWLRAESKVATAQQALSGGQRPKADGAN